MRSHGMKNVEAATLCPNTVIEQMCQVGVFRRDSVLWQYVLRPGMGGVRKDEDGEGDGGEPQEWMDTDRRKLFARSEGTIRALTALYEKEARVAAQKRASSSSIRTQASQWSQWSMHGLDGGDDEEGGAGDETSSVMSSPSSSLPPSSSSSSAVPARELSTEGGSRGGGTGELDKEDMLLRNALRSWDKVATWFVHSFDVHSYAQDAQYEAYGSEDNDKHEQHEQHEEL